MGLFNDEIPGNHYNNRILLTVIAAIRGGDFAGGF
jgi:hypothetical protein